MLELTNYTLDTAIEVNDSSEYNDYLEAHEDDEIGVSHGEIISLNQCDIEQYLDLTELELSNLQIVAEHCGYSYFNSLDEALAEIDELHFTMFDGATTLYEIAHKLNFEIGYEDELNMILGCTAEAYEQLSSYISSDDISHTIDTEFSYGFTDLGGYVLI